MHYMEDLKEMLCAELEEYAEKDKLTAGDLETLHKLTATIKDIGEIGMMEDVGYSEDGGWEARGNYGGGMPYNEGGSSYARGRGRNVKRDSMGRYSREGGGGNMGGGGYSQEGGYSSARGGRGGSQGGGNRGGGRGGQGGYSRDSAKDYMMEQLEEMLEDAENPKQREALDRCIKALEKA